jgi:glycosyltransferase involved in cell wall biosynthesis
MAKVSVIVPTYNVEQYIRKCLDSLVNQTSKDFIAYIINDGSPANEFEIANEYAQKYDFIKSIKKENGGYGSVLNMAFEMIDTPYALICDPDDYLVEDAIEHLLNLMEKNQADMVVASKNLIYSDNSEVVYDCSYNAKMVTLIDQNLYTRSSDNFKDLYFIDPSPHSKLYKTEFAKRVKFPLKVSFTDNLLFFICLNQASSVVYSKEAIAYYLINREGNTSTDVKPQVIDYWLKVQTEILDQSKHIDNIPDIFFYRMFETFKFVFNMIDRVHADKSVLKEKLLSTYTIFEPLQSYKQIIESYYLKMATTSGRERLNDLKLIQSNDQSFFNTLVARKLNRLVYGNGLKAKLMNLFGGV